MLRRSEEEILQSLFDSTLQVRISEAFHGVGWGALTELRYPGIGRINMQDNDTVSRRVDLTRVMSVLGTWDEYRVDA